MTSSIQDLEWQNPVSTTKVRSSDHYIFNGILCYQSLSKPDQEHLWIFKCSITVHCSKFHISEIQDIVFQLLTQRMCSHSTHILLASGKRSKLRALSAKECWLGRPLFTMLAFHKTLKISFFSQTWAPKYEMEPV